MSIANDSGNYLDREGFLRNLLEDKNFIVQAEMSDTWELMEVCSNRKKPVGVMALICKAKRKGRETHFCSFMA